jgi:hypothetical protein
MKNGKNDNMKTEYMNYYETDLKESIITYRNNNLVKKYIEDIRNIKKLDEEMINNISNMCNDNKMKIIAAYNDIVDAFSNFILTLK